MQLRDELAELVGQPVAARRREVAGALIAPRVVERMLRDGQQLDVREAEVRDVVGELARDLAVAQETARGPAAPRAEVHLVDRDRLPKPVALRAPAKPIRVGPLELAPLRGHGRGRGAVLEQRTERVGLEMELARVAAEDLVLVELSGAELR